MTTLLLALLALLSSVLVTAWLSRARGWLQVLDAPGSRSLHSRPTPRTGGLAILAGLLVAATGAALLAPLASGQAAWVGASALVVAAVSVADDRVGVAPGLRLIAHFGAASLLIAGGFGLRAIELPGFAWSIPALPAAALAALFVVWMVNLFNFMDGMDGIAGGMAVFGFGGLALVCSQRGDAGALAGLALVTAASAAGFLIFNFPPARIFMGDAGACTLGFLAAATLLWAQRDGVLPLWAGLLLFSPFVVDATATLVARLWRREKVWEAHRQHLYQRFVLLGWSQRRTVMVEYAAMAAAGWAVVLSLPSHPTAQWVALGATVGAYAAARWWVTGLERGAPPLAGRRLGADLLRAAGRLRTRFAVVAHDLAMILAAWLVADGLRAALGGVAPPWGPGAWWPLPAVFAVQAGTFWYFGLYRGIWRFASIPDFLRIAKAVAAATAILLALGALPLAFARFPPAFFALDALVLLLLLGGPRLIYRWLKDRHLYRAAGRQSALVVGAGRAGERLVRDMLRDPASPYRPVALVDDDEAKVGDEIHGLPVAGTCAELPRLVAALGVEAILIAMPSARPAQRRRVVEICEQTGLPLRTLPGSGEEPGRRGGETPGRLREVVLEDLLGRDETRLDWLEIEQAIRARTVLVTGGGGSIGAELCRQVARLQPAKLLLCERCELNLYRIDQELREAFPQLDLQPVLADVGDEIALGEVFAAERPSTVFHAAAYKHVPMLEAQARAAVVNNVAGTRVVASLADRHGCESFVLISSDKAVNPASVMGTTKRVAEIVCQDLASRSTTRFVTVRFGNVLGSSGSVVPLFQQQISRGGPVTVTHPEVERYFMTIPEACQLILQASVIGRGGEIFVLDMGEPVKISYLAEQLIRLAGKTPGEDVEITYTGLRPGEKLTEELFHGGEKLARTSHPKILLAACRRLEHRVVARGLAALEAACRDNDVAALLHQLSLLVPEHPDGGQPLPTCHLPMLAERPKGPRIDDQPLP
jgi:FlaA1/EpsC-like NDP-sugar epimerase/UDP-N-acetylmuramyl pentapeptide phosphotransferase/UDP-N-acetylglucosamine-1-phosphate transferase